MKTSQKKALFILGIVSLMSVLNFFFPIIYSDSKHALLLAVVLLLLLHLLGVGYRRDTNDIKILRNILIYISIYYLAIYLLGLWIGFARTIYNYKLSNLVLNIIPSILTIIGVETIRGELIYKTNKNKLITVLSCITFILFEISIDFTGYHIGHKEGIYQLFGLLIATSITSNILMTIIHLKTDKYPAMVYRFLMETMSYVLLIEPNLGPYLKSVLLIMLPVVVGLMVIGMNKKVQDSPEKHMKFKKSYFIIIIILAVIVLLNTGLIKYQSLVIGSDSMKPYISRGDVVIVDQTKNSKDYKEGDIMAFIYDNKVIVHRIILKTKRSGKVYYKTKGDNNKSDDKVFLSRDQVKGKVLFRIKYIGLPSVWLNELFK